MMVRERLAVFLFGSAAVAFFLLLIAQSLPQTASAAILLLYIAKMIFFGAIAVEQIYKARDTTVEVWDRLVYALIALVAFLIAMPFDTDIFYALHNWV